MNNRLKVVISTLILSLISLPSVSVFAASPIRINYSTGNEEVISYGGNENYKYDTVDKQLHLGWMSNNATTYSGSLKYSDSPSKPKNYYGPQDGKDIDKGIWTVSNAVWADSVAQKYTAYPNKLNSTQKWYSADKIANDYRKGVNLTYVRPISRPVPGSHFVDLMAGGMYAKNGIYYVRAGSEVRFITSYWERRAVLSNTYLSLRDSSGSKEVYHSTDGGWAYQVDTSKNSSFILGKQAGLYDSGGYNYVKDSAFYYNLNKHGETYYAYSNAMSNLGVVPSGNWYHFATLFADGVGPYSASTPYTSNRSGSTIDIIITGVKDDHVGMNYVQFPTWTKSDQSDIKWLDGTWISGNDTVGHSYKVTINKNDFGGATTGYLTHVYGYDLVGNSGYLGSVSYNLSVDAPPIVNGIYPSGHDYQNGNVYWVRPNVTMTITTQGSVNGDTSKYLTDQDILLAPYGRTDASQYVKHWASSAGSRQWVYNGNESLFNNPSNGNPFNNWMEGGRKHSSHSHVVRFTTDWSYFRLGINTSYLSDAGPRLGTGDVWSDKYIQVDGTAPTITVTKTWTNVNNISVSDGNGSGVKWVNIVEGRVDANSHSFWANTSTNINHTMVAGKVYTVIAVDNVGNRRAVVMEDNVTRINYSYSAGVIEEGGKKYMQYAVKGSVTNPVPGKNIVFNHSLRNNYTYESMNHLSSNNSISTTFKIPDNITSTQAPTPTFTQSEWKLKWPSIADPDMSISIWTNAYIDSTAILDKHEGPTFKSGNEKYQVKITQIRDANGQTMDKVVVNAPQTGTEFSTVLLPTGKFIAEIYMFDFNGNRTPVGSVMFDHMAHPLQEPTDLFVTAVKDVNWMNESYPIKYSTSTFPLGKAKLNSNGEGIKAGYAINYHLTKTSMHLLNSIKVSYRMVDESGNTLNIKYKGSSLADVDMREGTNFTRASGTVDREVYFKHFIPAPEALDITTTSGARYTGKMTVIATVTSTYGGQSVEEVYNLYTVDLSKSAYDDIKIDRQR